ncbi:protein translocase subunit SecD [Pseudaestuariivita rosea]|uniref:protein translocase subunit SecD n=1 Tax=Pseudaestuariivita rosea TaxID=2763263 RepID=UPI001ABB56A0|nr:protein translocase subunit SecD [Pseudaestuariivita rosea]
MLQIEVWQRVMIWLVIAFGALLAMPNAFYTTVDAHNTALTQIERNGTTPELEADVAAWPDYLPSGIVNLGLDLRGGASLLTEIQLEDVYQSRMVGFWQEVFQALNAERPNIGTFRRQSIENGEIRVRLTERPDQIERAMEIVRGLSRPTLSLTGGPSSDIEVRAEGDVIVIGLSEAEKQQIDDLTMQQSLEVIRRRIDAYGTREPTIQRQGDDRILVQVPGDVSTDDLESLLSRTARLSFHPVVRSTSDPQARVSVGQLLLPDAEREGAFYILEEREVVSGQDLVDSRPTFQDGRPAVNFRFNSAGGAIFGRHTAENIGALFAIVLDGEVISAPRIQTAITGGSGVITGEFTLQESAELAILLRSGALPAGLDVLQKQDVGPDLGEDSINAGRIACIVAFIAVLVFMFLSYGRFGLFANVALIINVILIFGLLSLIGATLTLPGIAGIVLTIGMAVDANVLIFERIKEELKSSKGPARAIELGYERALSAIIDANITTFITALILYVMGSGPVRGFAITLGLGIITSVFTAIFVTRLFVVMWFEYRRPKTIEV